MGASAPGLPCWLLLPTQAAAGAAAAAAAADTLRPRPDLQVAVLFRNHQDLLDEFTYFLPDNTPPAQVCGQAEVAMLVACTPKPVNPVPLALHPKP